MGVLRVLESWECDLFGSRTDRISGFSRFEWPKQCQGCQFGYRGLGDVILALSNLDKSVANAMATMLIMRLMIYSPISHF